MSVRLVKQCVAAKSTRINLHWDQVVLPKKVLPELELVAKAQAIYDMGMGIPPATRVVKDYLTGAEVVIMDSVKSPGDWDDFWIARAVYLKRPEYLPKWAMLKGWNQQIFRREINSYANLVDNPEARVIYWRDLRVTQSNKLKKSGPDAVLRLTHKILLGLFQFNI